MSIKLVLAWSTIAQMGFMLVQCGLGVWHLALLHLLAHSFYKAHSFLTSGSVVETWRGSSLVKSKKPLWGTALALCLMGTVAVGRDEWSHRSSFHVSSPLRSLTLALVLSFVPMFAKAVAAGPRAFGRALLFALGATVCCGHDVGNASACVEADVETAK